MKTMGQFLMIIIEFFERTANFLFLFFSLILAVFSPISALYHVILVFITLNLISGVIDDLKQGHKFSWDKFKTFLLRVMFYIMTISIVFLFECFIITRYGIVSQYLTATCTGLISLYEIQSFMINASKITGNPIFIKIFDKLKKLFTSKN